ncbi:MULTISPECIES: hypothetical protein [Polaromonas]|uniref:Uncharacterized protein n=1 Tax=Polaromonas aquatica TaxID=332657 RepID=A0ABW1U2E3_9BURK
MSILPKIIGAARAYLRLPSIEADLKTLNDDLKTLNKSVVASDINTAKVQAIAQAISYNEKQKFDSMLHALQKSMSISNAELEKERRRREDAENQLTVAIAILTKKINRIESLVEQRNESTGDRKEQ